MRPNVHPLEPLRPDRAGARVLGPACAAALLLACSAPASAAETCAETRTPEGEANKRRVFSARSAVRQSGPRLRGADCWTRLEPSVPGRFASAGLGVGYSAALGSLERPPPALLRVLPELQLAWGLRLGDAWLLTTRLDLLGAVIVFPVGVPGGAGADLAATWMPDLAAPGWGPALRFSAGGLFFSTAGEPVRQSPEYQAYGARLAAEGGVRWTTVAPTGVRVVFAALAGAQAMPVHVEPCHDLACDDAFLGPTLRGEAGFLF